MVFLIRPCASRLLRILNTVEGFALLPTLLCTCSIMSVVCMYFFAFEMSFIAWSTVFSLCEPKLLKIFWLFEVFLFWLKYCVVSVAARNTIDAASRACCAGMPSEIRACVFMGSQAEAIVWPAVKSSCSCFS